MTCMLTKSNQLAVTAARVVTDMINDVNQTNKHTHVRTCTHRYTHTLYLPGKVYKRQELQCKSPVFTHYEKRRTLSDHQ